MRYTVYTENTANFLRLDSIGYSKDPNITRFGPGHRNQYIIHYVMSGKGYYNGNAVHAGQGFLIFPRQKQYYYADSDDPWEFLWFIAYADEMKDVFGMLNADSETNIFSYDNGSVLKQTTKFIVENNNMTVNPLQITEIFLHVLNSHVNNFKSACKTNSQTYTDFCVNYIETNIHKKITVHELTALLGVSQPYLYKIFYDRFNMSVKKYIILFKHNYAKKLLSDTELTVKEVANSTGYDDSLVFSKVFKLNEGVSPSEYRKRNRV